MLLATSLILLFILTPLFLAAETPLSKEDSRVSKIAKELRPRLSSKASITHNPAAVERFSDYHAPKPGTIVNVASENDVVETVRNAVTN